MSSSPKSPFDRALDRLSWYLPDLVNQLIGAAIDGPGDPGRAVEWLAGEFVPESVEPDKAVVLAGLTDLATQRATEAGRTDGGGR